MRWWRKYILVGVCVSLGLPASALATLGDPSFSSTNYRVQESEIGGNGQFQSGSTNYSINPNIDDGGSSLGESAVGNSSSASYQTNAGFNTTAQPGLTFLVNTATVNLGNLTAIANNTNTASFSAKNYTSYGYVIIMVGNTPTNTTGGHQLASLATDTASSAGTEQFGVNTVRNTIAAVGANPVQNPSGTTPTFGFGVAGAGDGVPVTTYGIDRPYTISDKWRYNSGEVVASSPRSTGETDYTMTFMANMSNVAPITPGGQYRSNMELICTGTF